jgi:drug/metabolite transporter (DMT)-like permease
MTADHLGQMYALLTAITWGAAVVLFKRSGDRVPPLALNLFKNLIGILLLFATIAFEADALAAWSSLSTRDLYILAASGILGIAIADTVFFAALNLCGVGIIAIVDCVYSPFVLLFSVVLLGETLNWPHFVGGALVISAIVVASGHPPPPDRSRAQIVGGMFLGAGALAMMALGIVWAKPSLEGVPLVLGTTIRMTAGTAALALVLLASPARMRYLQVFRPAAVWWSSVPASVLGAYLSMMFWVAGFKYTKASTAAILNQTSVVFSIVFAAIILRERLTVRKIAALALALSGAALIQLTRP